MACKDDEEGCVTLIWEIQNFSLLLSLEKETVFWTNFWKTEHTGRSVRRRMGIYLSDSDIEFDLLSAECSHPDRCEVSFISSGMEVPLKRYTGCSVYWTYKVGREAVFGEKRQSILPSDTLTLRCKMWEKTMKTQEFCINSVLRSFSYLWNIENFNANMNYNKYIDRENLVFGISLKRGRDGTHRLMFGDVSSKECGVSLLNFKISYDDGCMKVIEICDSLNDWICQIKISLTSTSLNLQLESVFAVHKVCQDTFKLPSAPRYENFSKAVSGALGDDFLLLYRDKLFADATLNTKGQSFHVHRNILSARSPVFRAMFETDEMSEGRSGVVDIDDVDSETVDRLLVYLYGASLRRMQQWEEASALYYAADKYDIQPLKHKCAGSLKEGLTVDNACEVLALADRHSDDQLMKCIMDFIRQNEEVMSSEKWDNLENSNPLLAAKILRKIYVKNRKK